MLYVHYIACLCTVWICSMYTIYNVYVQDKYVLCTLYIMFMYSSMYTVYIVYVQDKYVLFTLYTMFMYSMNMFYVQCTLYAMFMYGMSVFSVQYDYVLCTPYTMFMYRMSMTGRDAEGLIIPRKISNPCLSSPSVRDLNREIKWNAKTWVKYIFYYLPFKIFSS